MPTHREKWAGTFACGVLALGLALAPASLGQGRTSARARHESIVGADGSPSYGQVAGDAAAGFRFEPIGGGPAVPLERAKTVTFDGPGADARSGSPPMRVLLGLGQQVSGRLGSVDDRSVELQDGPGGLAVSVSRGGALALAQRPGEAIVLQDGFETIDPARWDHVGEPEVVDSPRVEGGKSLKLPTGGSAVTCRLAEPVASGRLEVAFHDPGQSVPGQRWFVDLMFRKPEGNESIRAVIDLGEESLAVQSLGAHGLAVQRLARRPGWHRLGVRFGPETELSVDGDELAHGRGIGGPLVEVRLANESTGDAAPPKGTALHFDDLRLVRLSEPVGAPEIAPGMDDVRLVNGDQVFGRLEKTGPDAVGLAVDGRDVMFSWSEVASVWFRRRSGPSRPVDGLLVHVEWSSAPGNDPRDVDKIDGALLAVGDRFVVATPYAGDLSIPRERLRRLDVLGRGRRIVVDATPHHLGNNDSTNDANKEPYPLDPPLPEGATLERTFALDRIPEGAAALVLDVVQVEGETTSAKFAKEVANGELRTSVKLNGKSFDYLNRHIVTRNDLPERIRLAIPPGLLVVGENRLRFEQSYMISRPEELDDLGLLSIAIEFPEDRP